MNQLPFLDSDNFTHPSQNELEAFLECIKKCIKNAKGDSNKKVYRFLLIAPVIKCGISQSRSDIEVTLVRDVSDEKRCNRVDFDAVLCIGGNITFTDDRINRLKNICTNNAQHMPLFVVCQIEDSQWLRLSKEFICVDHVRYSKTGVSPYLTIACFPNYEIATEYGVTHDSYCHKLINVGVRTIADQMQRLYNIALHPLPTTITFYEGSNGVRNANPWIVKQANYQNKDSSRSLQSIFLTVAGLAQRWPDYKPSYTWLTSPEMQNVGYADSFEIFISDSKEGVVNVSSKEIGIPEGIISEAIAKDVSDSDAKVVDKEQNAGAVVAGEFGSSSNASSLDDSERKFVERWHNAFWKAYEEKEKKYRSFFNEAWRFYTSIMRSSQKISEKNFKYFIFSRAYILGKNSKSRLLFFPYWSEVQRRPLFAALMIYQNYSKAKHDFLLDLLERTARNLENIYIISLKELESIKSAIGSIMSRNGSHNIGSHVLAALSHNVGTMPEDRVLYQYIQQRMDYIATATTEFPTWRQPTMLVSDMMRTFLSQTHLLNYISRSDGLRAYQFQNPTVDKDSQYETIRLHVRRIRASDENWEGVSLVGEKDKVDSFIEYGEGGEASFDKDIAVAIPGGVVGQQAFFTIMENIIRNAAKHEWSKVTPKKKKESYLDVYVDFHDSQREGIVEMRIWTDCKGMNAGDVQGIIADLEGKIKRSFISPDSGALVRENWGLAEMRIATGFLRDSGIEKIGGIGEEVGKSCELVRPVAVKHGEKICLGYRFDFLKPKELLVIVPDGVCGEGANDKSEDDIRSINRELGQFGIELMRKGKVNELSKGLPYSYIVVENIDFAKDERVLTRMPFRILSRNPAKNPRNKHCKVIAEYVGTFYDLKSNDTLKSYGTIDDKLRELRESFQSPDEVKKFAHNLLEGVYASWVNHIRDERKISSDAKLVIDVNGDGTGAAKSLVADSDLLHFVFEHSFNSAVRGYLKIVGKNQIHPELAGALYSFAMLDCKKIMSVEDLAECKNSGGQELDVACKIALQLVRFAEICLSKLPNSDERTGVKIDVEKTDMDGNAYVDERWTQSLRQLNLLKCLFYIYEGCKTIYNEENGDGAAGYSDVRAFIWYLRDVVLEQARSFLSKYEERITTIPETFVSAKAIADKADSQYGTTQLGGSTIVPVYEWRQEKDNGLVLSAVFSANRLDIMKQGLHKNGFCYWRHGDEDGNAKEGFLKDVEYFEPLSGSQSYLNALISLRDNVCNGQCLQRHLSDNRLSAIRDMTGLVESALMRILIIDERASKFEREHPAVARIFETTCITVLDDKSEDVLQLASSNPKFDLVEKFEIVIIHQGILDKILPNHSAQEVDAFLQKLKEHLRYVVITTGRGMPSNIPATARVLPFSIVERTMFTRHPEKMLLVDTVMNILPGEKR